MFITSLISFLLATIYWFGTVAPILSGDGLGNHSTDLLMFKENVNVWMMMLMMLISDGVVVWRACVLFSRQRLITIVLVAVLLGTTGTAFASLIMLYVTPPNMWGAIHPITNASLILSFINNLFSTSAFGFKLWQIQKEYFPTYLDTYFALPGHIVNF